MTFTTTQEVSPMQQHTRTAEFDPADYEFVALFDGHEEVGGWVDAADFVDTTEFNPYWGTYTLSAEWEMRLADVERTCVHCGKRSGFVLDFYFRHTPTGELLFVGSGCADDLGLGSKTAYAAKRAANALANAQQRAEVERKRAEWTAANPEAAAALDAYEADVEAGGEQDNFLDDLCRARRVYGALTEKQTPWATKALAKRAEWAAKREVRAAALATTPALEGGRYEVTGTVVSVKYVDNDFGGTFKMLVELADGNRVFGTVPASLWGEDRVDAIVDTQVAFTATVEPSNDDEHFGFYSRPTKARAL